jgi:uncharacterized membrane protein YjjP (DUF1212 family)
MDVLLRLGALMLRSGNTASRTHSRLLATANKMGFDSVSVALSTESITIAARRGGQWQTRMCEIGSLAIDVSRIAALEKVAHEVISASQPDDMSGRLGAIEFMKQRFSGFQIVTALGLASACFAFLNGAGGVEIAAAALGGCVGQTLRAFLLRRRVNHHGVTVLSAVAAAGSYVFLAAFAGVLKAPLLNYPAGLIASVLFLVPGFPILAGLFDLLQSQMLAALSRFASGVMILLCVALGLTIVIELVDIEIARQPPPDLGYALKIVLRAITSFIAASAFAMLFNAPWRIILASGLLAVAANGFRMMLIDAGAMPASGAFLAAFFIGLVAIATSRTFRAPPGAIAVSPIIIMVPGVYFFETIALFNHGQMLEAMQAGVSCAFIVGALAMGVAAARLLLPTCQHRLATAA